MRPDPSVVESGMPSDGIVEAVDISGNGDFGICADEEGSAPDQFGFQRLEECFDHGIVKAVTLARHRDDDAGSRQLGLIINRTILAAAIGVMNDTSLH